MNAYADGARANNEAMSTMMKNLSQADRKIIADYLATMQ
jgi:cytochrome c553